MSRGLFVLLLLLLPTPLYAALDPEVKQPYRYRLVLHIAKHRVMTEIFNDQIERGLRDGLQAALGDMALVEVVRQHPRLREIEEKGLQSLDGWKEISDVKTQFVLIDFVQDQYEIQARQYDGQTGQSSPVVRRELVTDRRFVARTAALLLAQDFGLIGTVTAPADGQTVRLMLKASGLTASMERWVKKGDVFALVRIGQGAAGLWANRVPWALVQVEEGPKDGVVVCRLFYRHPDPLALGPGVLGHRAIKLGATTAPVHLRFVEAGVAALLPRPNLQIHVRRRGFQGEESVREQGTTNADGFFQAGRDKPYDQIAFVTVLDGGVVRALIPVAIVDDRPIIIPISIKAEAGTPLLLRRNLWQQRIYENLLAQTELFRQLNDLAAKQENRHLALERAQTGYKALSTDIDNSLRELNNLRTAAKALPPGANIDLADGEQRIRDLQKVQGQLNQFVTGLEKVIKEENDPKRRELLAMIERGGLLESDAEFGKAIEMYQEVLKGGVEFPELQKRLDKLNAAWQIKDDKHRRARSFIYDLWPRLELAGLKVRLPDAAAALEDCKSAGDGLSPQRLLKVALAHVAKLTEMEARLNPQVNPDDLKTAETIAEVREGLGKLIQDAKTFLDMGMK